MNSRGRGGYSSSSNYSNMNSNNRSRTGRNFNPNTSSHTGQQAHNHHANNQVHPSGHLSVRDQADLESFRVALKELTFNSRPIIEKLTAMAKERARSIPGPISRTILDNLVFVRYRITLSNTNIASFLLV